MYDQKQNKSEERCVPPWDRPVLVVGLASERVRKCDMELSPIGPKQISFLPGNGSRRLSRTAPSAMAGRCHYKAQIGRNYMLPGGNA